MQKYFLRVINCKFIHISFMIWCTLWKNLYCMNWRQSRNKSYTLDYMQWLIQTNYCYIYVFNFNSFLEKSQEWKIKGNFFFLIIIYLKKGNFYLLCWWRVTDHTSLQIADTSQVSVFRSLVGAVFSPQNRLQVLNISKTKKWIITAR